MIRYRLEPSDVSTVRFGISPLSELGLGLRAFRAPERYPLQRPWAERIAGVLPLLDREILTGLVDERLWVADFVNPRPESPLTSFDDELRSLGRIRPERLRGDLEGVHGTVPPVFAGRHDHVVERLQQALAATWELCFAPYWPRMRRVLQSDVVHRGRIATHEGVGAVLTGLSDGVRFDGRYVDVRLSRPDVHERPVCGEGLTLVPSMFVVRASAPVNDNLPPTVMYPARGQGAMWSIASHPDAGAVRDLLGRTRSALLEALGEPASSTDLAMRFGMSTSAVNQHLRVMERSGLLNRTRYGRAVLYYRSTVGDALTRMGCGWPKATDDGVARYVKASTSGSRTLGSGPHPT